MLRMSTTPALSIPAFGALLGVSAARAYVIMAANGPKTRGRGRQTVIPITEAIQWVEREARRIRALENAATTLRVEWSMSRIQSRYKSRRRHTVIGPKPDHAEEAAA